MGKIIVNTGISVLLLFMMGVGCEKNNQDSLCYKGKVVSLNNNGNAYFNLVEIVNAPDNSKLPLGINITFDPGLYGRELNIGDIVSFKILHYEEWVGPHYAHCMWPNYAALIDPCIN